MLYVGWCCRRCRCCRRHHCCLTIATSIARNVAGILIVIDLHLLTCIVYTIWHMCYHWFVVAHWVIGRFGGRVGNVGILFIFAAISRTTWISWCIQRWCAIWRNVIYVAGYWLWIDWNCWRNVRLFDCHRIWIRCNAINGMICINIYMTCVAMYAPRVATDVAIVLVCIEFGCCLWNDLFHWRCGQRWWWWWRW